MSVSIAVTENRDGFFCVESGGRFAQLARDETLWAVACLLTGKENRWLRTYEEWAACERALWKREFIPAGALPPPGRSV